MTVQTTLQSGPAGGSSRDSGSWWCTRSCANQWWVCCPTTALPPRQQLYWVSLGDSAQKQNQNSMKMWPSDKHKATNQKQKVRLKLHHLKGAPWAENVCIHLQTLAGTSDLTLGSRSKFPSNKHTNISSKIYSLLRPMAMKFESTTPNGRRKLDLLTDKSKFRAKKYLVTGLHHWWGQFSSEIIRTMSEMAKNTL